MEVEQEVKTLWKFLIVIMLLLVANLFLSYQISTVVFQPEKEDSELSDVEQSIRDGRLFNLSFNQEVIDNRLDKT